MSVIFIVLPLAFVLAGAALAAFIWATRQGQFDDLDTPASRILFDEPLRASRARAESPNPSSPSCPTPPASSTAPS